MFRKLMLGVIVIALLAGCAAPAEGARAGSVEAPPPEFDATTGAISGVVSDDEARPIVGAQVGIQGDVHEQATVTDVTGKYTLSSVPPGKYQLFAQHLGYQATVRAVEVREGEVAEVRLVLVAIDVREGHSQIWFKPGYFECSWTGVGGTGPCFFPFVGQNSYVPVDPWTNNKRQFDYLVGEGVMTVTNELDWRQSSYGTSEKLSVFLSYTTRTTSHWYCRSEGKQPVLLRWERGDLDAKQGECVTGPSALPSAEPKVIPMKGQNLTSRVNVGSGTYGPAIAFQQSFDIHFGVFYWVAAPEDFTALADK